MHIITFIIIVVVLAFVFAYISKTAKTPEKKEYLPYVKNNYLMTKAEHEFFKVLQQVVQEKYYIIPQVQLSKIVRVNKYEKFKYKYANMIDRKSVDFVLFEKETFSPYLVIELDEESHQLPNREDRDHFVNAVMAKIGLTIVHIKTSYQYSREEIQSILNQK
jgi:very-short-patch-repair endonuclease